MAKRDVETGTSFTSWRSTILKLAIDLPVGETVCGERKSFLENIMGVAQQRLLRGMCINKLKIERPYFLLSERYGVAIYSETYL